MSRAAAALATVVATTLLTFLALALLPGDPLTAALPADEIAALSQAQRAALRAELGLDRPVLVRFSAWAARAVTGDLGRSFRSRRPVRLELAERLGPTVELNLAALALVALAGLPAGWAAARREGSRADRAGALGLLALYALPTIWVALLLQHLLAVRWPLLPLFGRFEPYQAHSAVEWLRHAAMPAICLAVHQLAFVALFARASAASGLRATHAFVARAHGVPEPRVFRRHGVRPSLVPLAALVGLIVPGMASGSVLIESIFSWPGIGLYFYQAVQSRDVPAVLALTVISSILTVAGSLAGDLLVRLSDPRARAALAQPR